MKCYYLGDKKITEAEAKEIEAKNREILRDGTTWSRHGGPLMLLAVPCTG